LSGVDQDAGIEDERAAAAASDATISLRLILRVAFVV
jgi:hypothetical protein